MTNKTRVYIAGPMRGRELYNFPAFDAAEMHLREQGFEVINPAQLDRNRGFFPRDLPEDHDWSTVPEGFDLATTIKEDVEAILSCDTIYCLLGWKESAGATAEAQVAKWAGKAFMLELAPRPPVDETIKELPEYKQFCSELRHTRDRCRESEPELPPSGKDTNPKDAIGSGKLPIHLWPSTATMMGCIGLLNGMLKYGRSNWRVAGVRASIYYDACRRHIDAWFEGEDTDPDDNVPHLSAALACLAIIVDSDAAGKLNDDRQVAGGYRGLRETLTPLVGQLKEHHAGREPRHCNIKDSLAVCATDPTACGAEVTP